MLGTVNNNIPYANPYIDKAKTGQNQPVDSAVKADDISKTEQSKPLAVNRDGDEYIHSYGDSQKSPGTYRFENDENGNKMIVFDRHDSERMSALADSAPEEAQAAKSPGDAPKPEADAMPEKENEPEKPCDKEGGRGTANTDKVDAEIKKLKTQKQQAQQELNRVRDDEEKRKEVEQRLAQIEAELSAKDNDAYRKANTRFASSSTPI